MIAADVTTSAAAAFDWCRDDIRPYWLGQLSRVAGGGGGGWLDVDILAPTYNRQIDRQTVHTHTHTPHTHTGTYVRRCTPGKGGVSVLMSEN